MNTVALVGSKESFQKQIKKLNDDVANILIGEVVVYFSVVVVLIVFGWL